MTLSRLLRPWFGRALGRSVLALTLVGGIGGSLPVLAQSRVSEPPPDRRIDAATGRDLAVWPPARPFDHIHMLLKMDIADIDSQQFVGEETLTLAANGKPRTELVLDARSPLTFSTVTVGGKPATFTREKNKLRIALPEPAAVGVPFRVVLNYTADKPGADGSGLVWLKSRPATSTRPARPALIYSQGEAQFNSFWFACHDFPNERLTTEIILTVPEDLQTISNGRLLSVSRTPGKATWHWLQGKPHAAYLVMIAIGKFDVVETGGPATARPGLSVPVYGPEGSGKTLAQTFANTPAMIACFEKVFDEPYPWDKYAQVIVRNFRWGGMENTSATVLAEFAARGNRGDQDDLISHELGHQWFGDLITCRGWENLWLNEGWATYCEAIWLENRDGKDAYFRKMESVLGGQQVRNRNRAPQNAAMVSNRYADPDEVFTKADDPYGKGGMILHMLRMRLGDETFWRGVRKYINRFKFNTADTDDFRKVLEEVSGQSLERFFDQWAKRPGIPTLAVESKWNQDKRELTLTLTQNQPIDADNPAYALSLPVYIELEDGTRQWAYVDTETRTAALSVPLTSKPRRLNIDPNITLLARMEAKGDGLDAPAQPAKEKPAAAPDAP